MKIGLSLSGGGARGIAHMGVLKGLEEIGIKPTMITGTSAGAIVGAFYCYGYSPDEFFEIIKSTRLFRFIRPALTGKGLMHLSAVEDLFKKYFENDSFEALKTPLVVASTDVKKGKSVYFYQGALIKAVMASSAIPVIFNPIEMDGQLYIDGGILNNLPVDPLVGHCDTLVGVSCNPVQDDFEMKNMKSLLERSLLMAINVNTYQNRGKCDLFLEPEKLKKYGAFDFNKSEEIFEIGYHYVLNKKEQILQLAN